MDDGPSEATRLGGDSRSHLRRGFERVRENRSAVVGVIILSTIILSSIIGPGIYGVDAMALVERPQLAPSVDGGPLLGTDVLGRDILAGILVGGRTALFVGFFAAALSMSIGVLIGGLAGYFGGWIDTSLVRLTELFQVLPPLLLAMVVVTLFEPSLMTVAVAIGSVSWPAAARIARAEFLRIKTLDFVKAARSIGSSPLRIMSHLILPNALPPLVVMGSLVTGVAILFEAGLSFLGLADPNIVTWGSIIGNNRTNFLQAWWPVTFPGIAIFLTVLSFSLVGDGLNDLLDPKGDRS